MKNRIFLTAQARYFSRRRQPLIVTAIVDFITHRMRLNKNRALLSVTIPMDEPASQRYHVMVRSEEVKTETLNVTMPVWTPGHYLLMYDTSLVDNFLAMNGARKPLKWAKTANSH